MSHSSSRIPDDMAAEVLAEAARLFTEANTGYSLADLEQAGLEAQIPAHIIRQAIKNVEEKRSRRLILQRQHQEYITQQVRKGVSFGIALLIPAIAVSGIFIFRSQLKPVISGVISSFNNLRQKKAIPFQTLTVKQGKLEYLTDPKGLSISVSDVSSSSVGGTIGTDDYKNLDIFTESDCNIRAIQSESDEKEICQIGKLGKSYDYQGIYNYRIKIVEVTYDSATFQIEQLGQQPQSAVKRLEENAVRPLTEKVKQFRQEREKLTSQLEELQKERNSLKHLLQSQNNEVKRLEKENREYRVKCIKANCPEQ
ncbi:MULTISPECIES: hypothetical protein [Nostocales]|uniref:Uncharacterized protein n=3 Tax=Nostocales TaxID=1161 RepID=A0A0C1NJG1_9CYAN|nr:hypothetical protein [Tolypothrix bouteillei]KAF3888126.1 hypothetical protein DA73_0400023500 [Tolypothrix bouteillei VB521301]